MLRINVVKHCPPAKRGQKIVFKGENDDFQRKG
jgi:hypothetical protein